MNLLFHAHSSTWWANITYSDYFWFLEGDLVNLQGSNAHPGIRNSPKLFNRILAIGEPWSWTKVRSNFSLIVWDLQVRISENDRFRIFGDWAPIGFEGVCFFRIEGYKESFCIFFILVFAKGSWGIPCNYCIFISLNRQKNIRFVLDQNSEGSQIMLTFSIKKREICDFVWCSLLKGSPDKILIY